MLYIPKFCCNCGEKIDVPNRTLWTSRRFCDVCSIEQSHHELLVRAIVFGSLLAAVIGASGFFWRPPAASPQKLALSAKPANADLPRTRALDQTAAPRPPTENPVPSSALTVSRAFGESSQPAAANVAAPKAPAADLVYYCGAITKKGTPCSRRVKVPGRCWQHLGQPAAAAAITRRDAR